MSPQHPQPHPVAGPAPYEPGQPVPAEVGQAEFAPAEYGPAGSGPAGSGPAEYGPGQPVPAEPVPAGSGPVPARTVPGRRAFRILVAVGVVLAVAIAVTAVLGWSDVSDLRKGVADRRAERTATARQEQAAARTLAENFRGAGLESLLQRVKDLDRATDVAFRNWRSGAVRFGVLDGAMNDCNDAVVAYNSAAGPFPDHLFATVPRQIDLKSPETDCGRAFTASI